MERFIDGSKVFHGMTVLGDYSTCERWGDDYLDKGLRPDERPILCSCGRDLHPTARFKRGWKQTADKPGCPRNGTAKQAAARLKLRPQAGD